MTQRSDFVSIEVAGERLDTWTEYSVDSDLLTPADAFHLTLAMGGAPGEAFKQQFWRVRRLCERNARVQLFIGADIHGGARTRALQLTGYIDTAETDISRAHGTILRITGRDLAGPLCDSAVSQSLIRDTDANATFADLARAAVAPWSIPVITDASAARSVLTGAAGLTPEERIRVEQARAQGIDPRFMTQHILRESQRLGRPVDELIGTSVSARARRRSSSGAGIGPDFERLRIGDAAPRAGESVWGFLQRHAERLHVMMWMSPDGKLIIGTPDYDQAARYRFVHRFTNDANDPNNCEMKHRADGTDLYSKVTVYGRAHGQDVRRSPFRGVVKNDTVPFRRAKIEHLHDVRTQAEAEAAAHRIMREGLAMSEVVEVDADDHGQGRYLYAIDTMADLVCEAAEIDLAWYVIGRTFTRSRDAGTRTALKLIQPDSLTL